MIRVSVKRDCEGFIWSFTVEGHAGYAQSGKDIVCAYASGVVYTALGGLDELAEVKNFSEKDGFIRCTIPKDIAYERKAVIRVILETMVIGLRQLENQYGEHITIRIEEV